MRVAERTRELEESHEALSSSERRFRALIENGIDGVVLIDATGHVLYVESRGLQYRGLHARGTDRPARPRERASRRCAGAPARARSSSRPNPANPCAWSGASATRTGTGCGSKASPPTCSTIRRCGAIVTNYRDITERLAHETRLARTAAAAGAVVAHHARHRRTPGPAQHFPGGGRAARGRAAGGFLRHLPARRRRAQPHGDLHRRAQRAHRRAARHDPRHQGADRRERPGALRARAAGVRAGHRRDSVPVSATARRRGPGRHGHRAPAGGEQGVRRADLCAPAGAAVSRAANASSCARRASTPRSPRTRRSCTKRCSRPTTTCARRNNSSCSRSGCARSARWPAASRTTSTMRSRRWRCTPRRCSSASRFPSARAATWRSFSAPSTTSRRPWRAWASSTGSANRSSRWCAVDLNKLVRQVVDLTRARWSDMALQRGVAIDMRLELGRQARPHRRGRKPDPRRTGEPGLQRGRCHAAGRRPHAAHAPRGR